jgi:hypothetical protein
MFKWFGLHAGLGFLCYLVGRWSLIMRSSDAVVMRGSATNPLLSGVLIHGEATRRKSST